MISKQCILNKKTRESCKCRFKGCPESFRNNHVIFSYDERIERKETSIKQNN